MSVVSPEFAVGAMGCWTCLLLCSRYLFAAQETGVSLLRVLSLLVQDQTQVRLEVRWPRRRMVLVWALVLV